MKVAHALEALAAVTRRELLRFAQQRTRLISAVLRPSLWLLVFTAGLPDMLGDVSIAPYAGVVSYQVYMVPGLLGMVLLFNGMQSSLAMVHDREMGIMRLLLTAPLPRSWLLSCKLLAGTLLSVLQAYAFLAVCAIFRIDVPWHGWLTALPALLVCGLMLGALGLLLSVTIRQLENFASTMNFVIFPMLFLSSALHPLTVARPGVAHWVCLLSQFNPFTYAVELIRFALYGQWQWGALAVVAACLVAFFAVALAGYDPQIGLMRRRGSA